MTDLLKIINRQLDILLLAFAMAVNIIKKHLTAFFVVYRK